MENWEASLSGFRKRLDVIETEAKEVLDQCIPCLRSAEQGIILINNIAEMKTRTSLVAHMQKKHENVLEKFVTEIETVELEFLVIQIYKYN